MKSQGILVFYNTWAIAYCDEGLRKYYAYLLEREKWIKLMMPKWGAHISVIRGDGETVLSEYQKKWKKYDGRRFDFEYGIDIAEDYGGGGRYYYWLPVECSFLLDIREEFGLGRDPIVSNGLHLTLGSMYV